MPRSENLLDSKGRPYDRFTDKLYELQRNSLIPAAVKYADKECGIDYDSPSEHTMRKHAVLWNLKFHKKMNELWIQSNKKKNND